MRRGVSQPAIHRTVLLPGVSEAGEEGSVMHDFADELAYLDELPDPEPGLNETDLKGCRWISGEPTPLRPGLFCGKPTALGSSWCPEHRRIAFGRNARKRDAA
jgi:hypothetical protein